MHKLLLGLGLCLLTATSLFAQTTGTPTSRLGWDQPNSSATEAQSFTYRIYADGATTGTALTGVTCTGTAPVQCSAPFPAFTPGSHSVTLTAGNAAGESAKSAPFAFVFVVLPSVPVSLRIE